MEQRPYNITAESLPQRQLRRARARGFIRMEALGATEAEAVATLRTLLDREIARIRQQVAPLLRVDAVSGIACPLGGPAWCLKSVCCRACGTARSRDLTRRGERTPSTKHTHSVATDSEPQIRR